MVWLVIATPWLLYPQERPGTHRIGVHGQSGQVQKILPQLGFYPRTVQPVVICYTDWVIMALGCQYYANLTAIIDVSVFNSAIDVLLFLFFSSVLLCC
jgi:hypothetical protein